MELNIEPIRTYNRERINARMLRNELDTRFFPDDYGKYYYARYLEDTIQQPTVGMIAIHEAKKKPLLNYPRYFERNKKIIEEQSPEVKKLKMFLDETLQNLYPKTKKLREFIIQQNRIDFDTIKKSKGYNLLNKLELFLK